MKYTVCLTEIPESKYTTFYAVRGYMKFTDKNGIASATYTTQEISSLYKEACDTEDTAEEDRTDVHNDIIEKAEALTAAAYDTLMASLKTPAENNTAVTVAGETLTDEEALATNNIIYKTDLYGTRYLRSITVDTGMNVEETDLLFVTDTHVTYSNEKDINTRYYNAMAYYKSRAYYGSSFNSRKAYAKSSINSANLASLFDKVVLGGDMADYVSDGNFQATKRIWSDRNVTNGNSLRGTISMTPGNHEFSQSSATAEEKLTNAELHDIHNGYMTSNSYIDYDIVYKADGKTPNYMTITLDNSLVTYYEEQIAPLTEYLAYARENNIPVILFQHVPNATGNEADADYWYTAPEHLRYAIGGRTPDAALYKKWQAWLAENPDATDSQKSTYSDTLYAAGTNADGEAYPKGWQWTNMYNGTGHTGWNAYNEDAQGTATQIVYNLITSNYDIIKAVFCGHHHTNYTTGIVATDADGNKFTDDNGEYITIPQYTVPAGYQNYATIINVK